MKFYIYISFIFMVVSQLKAEHEKDIHKMDMACREENHVTEDDMKKLLQGDIKEPKDDMKCYMKCMMEKEGIWKNGAFNESAAKQKYESIPALKDKQELISKSIEACKNKKGKDECDTSFLITSCFVEHHMDSSKG